MRGVLGFSVRRFVEVRSKEWEKKKKTTGYYSGLGFGAAGLGLGGLEVP